MVVFGRVMGDFIFSPIRIPDMKYSPMRVDITIIRLDMAKSFLFELDNIYYCQANLMWILEIGMN